MSTLILLRHGRTTANTAGILAGDAPVELDDTGVAQAKAAAERLAELTLAQVVSSPLVRCRQTLELAVPGAEVAVEPGLTECGYGEWSGRPLKELAEEPLWRTVQVHPSAAAFPGGESISGMSTRAIAAVRAWDAKISAEHGPEAIWLACSHGDVIKSIVADALGMHLDLFQRIQVSPGSLTVIRYTTDRPFLLRLSDTGESLKALVPQHPPAADEKAGDAAVGGGA